MAFKQALSIGTGSYVYKCSILKEEEIEFAYYSSASNPVYWTDEINSSASYWDKYYESIGDNFNEYLSGTMDTNPRYYVLNNVYATYHALCVICSLNDKEFLCADVTRSGTTRGPLSFCFTEYVEKPMLPSTINKFGYTIPTYEWSTGMRGLISVVFDDSIGELNFIVLHSIRTNQSSLYSVLNTVEARKEAYSKLRDFLDTPSTDPWRNSGFADIGGGDCELDLISDIISLPNLPTSVASTGFIQLYAPSFRQINELSDYMWGDGFFNNVLKLWNDPMDIIINLAQFPINIPIGGTQRVTAGNVVTTVEMNYPSNQYVELDCGSLEVKHFYNAYLDYEPYTSCKIFLPYVGTETLSMDDIMGKTVNVKYRIDLMSGACVAFILCDNVLLYTFTGACSINIPVSGQTFAGIASAVISTVTAGAVAKGAGVTSKGNPIPSSKPGAVASSLASNVMACKPVVERSGTISANMGLLGAQRPYLIFTVPRTCLPKNQNEYLGYPTFMTLKLSEITGYTEIEEIRLDKVACTEEERDEIKLLLKEGVIL